MDCGRKFLTLLPEIGSGDEDSEEFEVCEGVEGDVGSVMMWGMCGTSLSGNSI